MRPWVRWQDWVNVLCGAWLFVSPWLVGNASAGSAAWNAWIAGLVVLIVALWALGAPSSTTPEWTNAVAGAWVFVAPWALGFAGTGAAAWNAWIVGLVVVLAAAWGLREATARSGSGPAGSA